MDVVKTTTPRTKADWIAEAMRIQALADHWQRVAEHRGGAVAPLLWGQPKGIARNEHVLIEARTMFGHWEVWAHRSGPALYYNGVLYGQDYRDIEHAKEVAFGAHKAHLSLSYDKPPADLATLAQAWAAARLACHEASATGPEWFIPADDPEWDAVHKADSVERDRAADLLRFFVPVEPVEAAA